MKIICALFCLFSSMLIANAQTNAPLVNLAESKKSVKEYYKSGAYDKDMDRIIDSAIVEVRKLKLKANSAFVFDIDETALSNMSYELNYDYGYNGKSWAIWIDSAKAPAIPQVKRFYDTLQKIGIKVLFITGRNYTQIEKTKENLINEGYDKYDTLICKTREFYGKKASEFKSNVRQSLSGKFEIIGSIGDQYSDFEGGYTILKIKLPNYMYWID